MHSTVSSTTMVIDSERPTVIFKRPPFHLRLAYFISLWSFKAFFALTLHATRLFQRRRSASIQPEVRSYSIRPDLKNRIFRPNNSGDEKLPLYLDVHGGGWAVADPETDDEFCSFIAQNFNINVVSVGYHKSPSYKFPCAVGDVAAITDAVLNDESLNTDKMKVVLGGFSAGGNLAFAASQMETLRGRVNGLVGFYAALDLSESLEEKLKRRPSNCGSDILASSAGFLDWAYVPDGHDRRDPLLSPTYASHGDLPPYIYLIGAEYDMLCYEAEQMAESLAAASRSARKRTGIPSVAAEDGWQEGCIRWECVRGKEHAFTHITKRGKEEINRIKICREIYQRLGVWLKDEVWGSECPYKPPEAELRLD